MSFSRSGMSNDLKAASPIIPVQQSWEAIMMIAAHVMSERRGYSPHWLEIDRR